MDISARTSASSASRCVLIAALALLLPVALAAAVSPASAAGRSAVAVSGKLVGGSGMTVMALAPDGSAVARTVRANGRFSLALPSQKARGATLHVVRASGSYLGPIVLARKGRRAYTALAGRAGELGGLVLRKSYALSRRPLSARLIERRVAARTDGQGRPIGAGKLGLVKASTRASTLAARPSQGLGADPDSDAIPSAIDADDNGNLTLDAVDTQSVSENSGPLSTLFVEFQRSLNANASGVTRDLIDSMFVSPGAFKFEFYIGEGKFGGRTVRGAHVDCLGLRYCRRGDGTAIVTELNWARELTRGSRWVDYSPDGSGYPNLERIAPPDGSPPGWAAAVEPRVQTSQIQPGDTMNAIFAEDGGEVTMPLVLNSFFVTSPAIVRYSSGGATTTLAYPLASSTPGQGSSNPAVLNGERLTLEIWRPQRPGISGAESAPFIDMGGLRYGITPEIESEKPANGAEIGCKGNYSGLSPTLSEAAGSDYADRIWPLIDSAADAAPDPSRTLSFTVDLGACLRAAGLSPAGKAVRLNVTAATRAAGWSDRAVLYFTVRMPG